METPGFKGPSAFQTTSWTLLGLLQEDRDRAAAFDAICERYQKPLWAYLRRQGVQADQAEDEVQEFFAHALAKGLFARPERAKGRFRGWLLTVFKHFNRDRGARRQARFESGRPSLDDDVRALEPADSGTPEEAFERQWAWGLVERTYRDLETLARARRERWKFDVFQLKCESDAAGERSKWREWGSIVGRPDKSKDQLAYACLQMQEEAVRILARHVACEFPEEDYAALEEEIARVWEIAGKGCPEG